MNDRPQVLVTGAAGFAGSHLVEHLAPNYEVTGWSRSEPPHAVASLARWTRVDLLDRERVRAEIRRLRPRLVYHCAGAAHVAQSWANTTVPLAGNVLTTQHLLDAIRRAGLSCKVLVTGSASVYATSNTPIAEDGVIAPASPYALSKLAQEQLGLRAVTEDGIEVVVARAFNHTGARQNPAFAAAGMARQVARIERGLMPPVIRVGNLEAQRDLTDVRDTVKAYALLMERGTPGAIYNVASGVARPIRAILEALVGRSRVPVEITTDPALFRPNDTPVVVGDASRLRATTGWAPSIGFDRMLDDLLEYWRSEN
ncbi:MAG: NAD-dependent epimerase/dehydratase family protein [Acidobacteria bacterium]|nr:NAD-dependent epimerase/dehydratase family protein [Acidobacteriota bacterium]